MFKQWQRFWSAGILSLLLVGCMDWKLPEDRLMGSPFDPKVMHRYYNPMVENAAAYDMSVADIHFVPHTDVLNELGTRRLDQLGGILQRYGGLVRYETASTDEDGITARLETITSYLADNGLDMTNVEVESKMSGGRGMSAKEAIAAANDAKKWMRQASRSGSGGAGGSPPGG